MKIFTVHDSKAQAYLQPIYFRSTGEAIRAFETTCKDKNSQFAQYPSDFSLLHIGEWNQDTAAIVMLSKPVILTNASEYAQKSL